MGGLLDFGKVVVQVLCHESYLCRKQVDDVGWEKLAGVVLEQLPVLVIGKALG